MDLNYTLINKIMTTERINVTSKKTAKRFIVHSIHNIKQRLSANAT